MTFDSITVLFLDGYPNLYVRNICHDDLERELNSQDRFADFGGIYVNKDKILSVQIGTSWDDTEDETEE